MHAAHGALQEHLVRRPVQVVRQSNRHADGQRQRAAQITRVPVMVLQPPAGTRQLVDAAALARGNLDKEPDSYKVLGSLLLSLVESGNYSMLKSKTRGALLSFSHFLDRVPDLCIFVARVCLQCC